jgi:hypothetical protein
LVIQVINLPLVIIEKPIGVIHELRRRGEVNLRPQRPGIVGCLGRCHCSREENERSTHFDCLIERAMLDIPPWM